MQELNDERVLFAFARDLEPALTVASGETVRIRTQDCFGNQVQTPEDELDEIDWDRINPATGPVFVEGAVPGGALKVTIENIELDPQTASCTGKDEGVCGDRFDAWSTHLCAIDGDKLVWNDQLSIPLNPMIGVIGVAPAGDPVNCGTPGSHGGNMDNTAITTGATLYFPVAVEGALFGCGDMHAAMGDGEISVSGAEVAGYATVTLTALPDLHLVDPLIENGTHLGIIASAESLDAAADRAVHEMVDLLHDRTGVDEAELVMLLSLVADVQVCQMVDPRRPSASWFPSTCWNRWGSSCRRREGGRAVAFSPDPIGGHLGGCVVPETCGFAAKAGRFGNALTGCVRLLQQLAHLAQQRLEADAAVFEVGLFGAHQHGVVHEVACERDGLLQRATGHHGGHQA